jgi:hypothetical protein
MTKLEAYLAGKTDGVATRKLAPKQQWAGKWSATWDDDETGHQMAEYEADGFEVSVCFDRECKVVSIFNPKTGREAHRKSLRGLTPKRALELTMSAKQAEATLRGEL